MYRTVERSETVVFVLELTHMESGTIVELTERSSGFIKRAGGKAHIFFHADALQGVLFANLRTGDKVSFDVIESLKGPYAASVARA